MAQPEEKSVDRRAFLKSAAVGVAGAATPGSARAHDHDHDHQDVPSDLTLRAKALESLLAEKGLVDPAALDAVIDTMEHKVGPRNGARVVARAWVDPAYSGGCSTTRPPRSPNWATAADKATTWSSSETRHRSTT
jgi:Nitrile hydratase, alpha chain